jgi:hypothetical protein
MSYKKMSYKNGDTVIAICRSYMYMGVVAPPSGTSSLTLQNVVMEPTTVGIKEATWRPDGPVDMIVTIRLDQCEAVIQKDMR